MACSPILVVGAGPTGLVLALSLVRSAVPVRIIDRHPGPGQESRAMVLHARNLEFYDQLDIARDVVDAGIKVARLHMREGGAEKTVFPLGDIGIGISPFPFVLCYPQDDHERLLARKLADMGVQVEWGTELTDFIQDEAAVTATIAHDGRQEIVRTPYLCGCDGVHSAVRHGTDIGFPGGTYEQFFYVADVETADEETDIFINLDAHEFGLKLPVRSTGMQRLIGLVPTELSDREDLSFQDLQARAQTLLGVRVQRVNWFSKYRVHHRVAEHFRCGRCFLAGDAGHVHSPAGGQGMNTGIGDAVNLAWKLAAVIRGTANPSILDTYEAERIPFARTLVKTTDRAFRGVAGSGLGSEALRTWLVPHLFPLLTGVSITRRMLFGLLSQTRISYRKSALSSGHAGSVQGGDRLPWVQLSDNFAPLRSRQWQVHVYGQAEARFRAATEEACLPLHQFEWTHATEAAGFARDAFYLLRPDGHVGLANRGQDPATLRAYLGRTDLPVHSTLN